LWRFSPHNDPQILRSAFSVELRHVLFATLLIAIPAASAFQPSTNERVVIVFAAAAIAVGLGFGSIQRWTVANVFGNITCMTLGMVIYSVKIQFLIALVMVPNIWSFAFVPVLGMFLLGGCAVSGAMLAFTAIA